jgi:hypothetical protein
MQLQIYIKPQDESFIKDLSERAKKYEFKGVKSLSELIILALKNYDPKISSFDLSDREFLEELIDKKINEKLALLNLGKNSTKEEKEEKEEIDLEALTKKELGEIIQSFNNAKYTTKELFNKQGIEFNENASLFNQSKQSLIKLVKALKG